MSRKKHTHQTKAEAHADEVVMAAGAAETAEAADGAQDAKKAADPFQRATVEVQGRIQKLMKAAEDLAKTRLSGTRMELLMDGLPARLEKALDAALDRVGLVRKSKLPGATQESHSTEAVPSGVSSGIGEAQPAE